MSDRLLYPISENLKHWTANKVLPKWVYKELQNKNLIFTLTTGRSGTGYLATILNMIPDIAAFHEPEPKFTHWMRQVQTQPDIAWYFWVLKKLPHIARLPESIYLETSHLFGKGFVEALITLEIPFDLILIKRDRRSVAKSLFQLNVIPGRTKDGLKFLISPLDPVLLPLPGAKILNDYQLCYWYTLEMETRAAKYARQVIQNGGKISVMLFEKMITKDGLQQLLNDLQLPGGDRIEANEYINKKINDRPSMKGRPFPFNDGELEALEREVLELTQFQEEEVYYA